MNKGIAVNIGGAFEAAALRILREIPGLTVDAKGGTPHGQGDAIIRFAGNSAPVAFEFKQRANAATAWRLVQSARTQPNLPLVLIAGETTAEARAILETHGIGVVDGLGAVHIELPGLLLHLEGRRSKNRQAGSGAPKSPTLLRGKAGVVAQALLREPNREWHVHDLAKEANVSVGLAHRVLARLEAEGLVAVEGTGPQRVRRITDPTAALDLWAEEHVERPTQTLGYVLAQTPRQLIEKIGTSLERSDIEHALTGAAAGSLVAPYVTAVPIVDLWVAATAGPDDLINAVHADAVTSGHNVRFLQAKDNTPLAFREKAQGIWVVNRFRLYGDLRSDPRRGREQADHLRQEVIGF